MNGFLRTGAAFIFILSAWVAMGANPPRIIPFQGHLTRPKAGNPTQYEPVPNGQYDILFTLYTTPAGGEGKVWGPECHSKVVVVNGLVNVLIGSVQPLPLTPDFFARPLYVGITIDADGNPNTPDLELVPRQVLLPGMYAHESGHAVTSDFATSATHADLTTTATYSDRANSAANTDSVPILTVFPFFGSAAQVPPGWAICDGRTISDPSPVYQSALGNKTPNLEGKFLRGAAPMANDGKVGINGGRNSVDLSHNHSGSANLTHSHTYGGTTTSGALTVGGPGGQQTGGAQGRNPASGGSPDYMTNDAYYVNFVGGGAGLKFSRHDHLFSGTTGDSLGSQGLTINSSLSQTEILPPFVDIKYIIRYR